MAGMSEIFNRLNNEIAKRISKGEREVARRFARSLAQIRKRLGKVYDQHEIDGKVTWEEMTKFNRINKLFKEINFILNSNYSDVGKQVNGILKDVYGDSFERSAYAFETGSKALLNYATASTEQIEAAMVNPVTKLSPTLWARFERGVLIHRIQQAITQGFVNGSTYATMSKALKQELNVAAYKTMRVVRTEGHRVQESAKYDTATHAEKHGVKSLKTWNTLDDAAVRRKPQDKADHVKLDGKTIGINDNFNDGLSIGPAPGLLPAAASSINCRCFLTYSVDSVDKPQYEELTNIPIEEWKEKRLVNKEIPGNPTKKEEPKPLTDAQKKKISFTNRLHKDDLKYFEGPEEIKEEYKKKIENGDFENIPLKITDNDIIEYRQVGNVWVGLSKKFEKDWKKERDMDYTMKVIEEEISTLKQSDGLMITITNDLDNGSVYYSSFDDSIFMYPSFIEKDSKEDYRRTILHELGHRVHQVPGEKLMVTTGQAMLNGMVTSITENDWKQFKKITNSFYSVKRVSVDREISRMDYPLNAKHEYEKGTKQHYYVEMFAEGNSVYLEGDKKQIEIIKKRFPGYLEFFEKIYQKGRI